MTKKRLVPLVCLWLTAVAMAAGTDHRTPSAQAITATPVAGASASANQPSRQQTSAAGSPDATLRQYCITCHNQRVNTGGLALDTMDLTDVAPHADTWEKVVRKVRTGMMPPAGMPRPPRTALDAFAEAIEARLDAAADPHGNLTVPALHRLNRTEYANAIRDLLAIDVDVTTLLPPEGSSEGFDNVAAALSVSPALVQGYVSAAMKISRLAVGDRTLAPSQVTYTAPPALVQDGHIDGLPLGTRGGMLVRHQFPLDGDYQFTVSAGPGGGGNLDVTLNGEPVRVENARNFRLTVPAGPQVLGVAIVDRQRGAGVNEIYSDFRVDAAFTAPGGVQAVTISGPFNASGVGDTPSRRRIFGCYPAEASEETPCARTILSTLARRAYRGPVAGHEIDTLMDFYARGRAQGDFEVGIQSALARVLVAPRFAFRVEEAPSEAAIGSVYRISDLELASRLSFFLWSSIPDDELLNLATEGRLSSPGVLQAQVQRMIADPRADAFVRNFAGQWLYLRELADLQTEAPNFDDNLRHAFRRETELLFGSIVREDRSVLTLLDADYTFLDERLARHYGIPNVRGSHFRRVTLPPDSPRRGLLGHGSILTVTSVATRTSPVMRGKWILETLLGSPPPEPPPGVETNLEEEAGTTAASTLRQRLELHRASPVCASCHNVMDPLGFSLENFDRVGAWRDVDGTAPIDASGQLADGTPLAGPTDLRQALLSRSDAFVTVMTEKLLIYALGRPVHGDDMPTVRAIVRGAAGRDHRFSALILGIVESAPFQMRVRAS